MEIVDMDVEPPYRRVARWLANLTSFPASGQRSDDDSQDECYFSGIVSQAKGNPSVGGRGPLKRFKKTVSDRGIGDKGSAGNEGDTKVLSSDCLEMNGETNNREYCEDGNETMSHHPRPVSSSSFWEDRRNDKRTCVKRGLSHFLVGDSVSLLLPNMESSDKQEMTKDQCKNCELSRILVSDWDWQEQHLLACRRNVAKRRRSNQKPGHQYSVHLSSPQSSEIRNSSDIQSDKKESEQNGDSNCFVENGNSVSLSGADNGESKANYRRTNCENPAKKTQQCYSSQYPVPHSSSADGDIIHRMPYNNKERKSIIRFIVKKGMHRYLKGNYMWKVMEEQNVCNRTWQSMKAQFMKHIYPNLSKYCLQDIDREKILTCMKHYNKRSSVYLKQGDRGWRHDVKYYTPEEHEILLKYVLEKGVYKYTRGNTVWKEMEKANILPGRSWQSMRSRFLTFISPHYVISESEHSDDDDEDDDDDDDDDESSSEGENDKDNCQNNKNTSTNGNVSCVSQTECNITRNVRSDNPNMPVSSLAENVRKKQEQICVESLTVPCSRGTNEAKEGAKVEQEKQLNHPVNLPSPKGNASTDKEKMRKKEMQEIRKCAVLTGLSLATNLGHSKVSHIFIGRNGGHKTSKHGFSVSESVCNDSGQITKSSPNETTCPNCQKCDNTVCVKCVNIKLQNNLPSPDGNASTAEEKVGNDGTQEIRKGAALTGVPLATNSGHLEESNLITGEDGEHETSKNDFPVSESVCNYSRQTVKCNVNETTCTNFDKCANDTVQPACEGKNNEHSSVNYVAAQCSVSSEKGSDTVTDITKDELDHQLPINVQFDSPKLQFSSSKTEETGSSRPATAPSPPLASTCNMKGKSDQLLIDDYTKQIEQNNSAISVSEDDKLSESNMKSQNLLKQDHGRISILEKEGEQNIITEELVTDDKCDNVTNNATYNGVTDDRNGYDVSNVVVNEDVRADINDNLSMPTCIAGAEKFEKSKEDVEEQDHLDIPTISPCNITKLNKNDSELEQKKLLGNLENSPILNCSASKDNESLSEKDSQKEDNCVVFTEGCLATTFGSTEQCRIKCAQDFGNSTLQNTSPVSVGDCHDTEHIMNAGIIENNASVPVQFSNSSLGVRDTSTDIVKDLSALQGDQNKGDNCTVSGNEISETHENSSLNMKSPKSLTKLSEDIFPNESK